MKQNDKWYRHSQIRNLVDMHIPNGEGYLDKFDPAVYAENVKKSGADAAYIYSGNCLGLNFYPSKVAPRHKAADRDIFGETVKECRKRGLKVVGYTNTWATFTVDEHPEWSVVYADGTTRRSKTRFGTPCINNEEYVQSVLARVTELISSYKLDGFWMDMVGIAAPVCHCEACKKKYGKPLPEKLDINDPAFYDYMRFKADCSADYLERVRAAALAADPDITVSFQTASGAKHPLSYGMGSMRSFAASDFLSGDFYTNRPGVNTICRMLYKLTNNLPFEFMTSRCVSLERHTMNKQQEELLLQSYAAMMYKGDFLFIDAIDPDGEMNGDFYEDIAQISKQTQKYLPYIDYEEKPIRQVAVYFNEYFGLSDQITDLGYLRGYYLCNYLENIDSMLSQTHIDYDLITKKHLDQLSDYKVLILSNLPALSQQETEAIRAFVANGGRLYVSGETSLRDDCGGLHQNFMLSDVLGLNYQGRFDIAPGYLAPTEERPALFGKHTRKYPHMLEERLYKVTPNDTGKILATVTLPISDTKDHLLFSSAISDPPITETPYPALFEHCYGKGRVIYSAGCIERDQFPDSRQLFAALINDLTGERRITVEAPTCVDFTAYESESTIKLHLLNSQTVLPPIPIASIKVSIALGGKTVRSVCDVSGGRLHWSVKDGSLLLDTDLDDYKLIVIETT